MVYDVAAKVLVEKCRNEILRQFMGMSVSESSVVEELPQETVSLRRADFAVRVTTEDGSSSMVVMEIQSRWEDEMPLRLLEYRTRYLIKYGLPTVSMLLLLRPSTKAVNGYNDEEVRYRYRFVPIYELEARDVLDRGAPCLYPLIPLMKGGPGVALEAEELLTLSELPAADKGDMLTSMALLSGLVSKEMAMELIHRRRDVMIESAAYEIIKNEGVVAGLQQGLQQGKIQEAREAILDYLEARFGGMPRDVVRAVDVIEDLDRLKKLRRASATVESVEDFAAILKEDR